MAKSMWRSLAPSGFAATALAVAATAQEGPQAPPAHPAAAEGGTDASACSSR